MPPDPRCPICEEPPHGGSCQSLKLDAFKMNSIVIPGLVTIYLDGRLVFHEGYAPTEAAKLFWESLAGEAPTAAYERGIEDAIKALWEELDEYAEGPIGRAVEDRIRRLTNRRKPR